MSRVSELPDSSPNTVAALKSIAGVTALEGVVAQVSSTATAAVAAAAAADTKGTNAGVAAAAAASTANAAAVTAGNAATAAAAADGKAVAAQTTANNAATAAGTAATAAAVADGKAVSAQGTAATAASNAASALSIAQGAAQDVSALEATVQAIQDAIGGVNQVPVAVPIALEIDEDVLNHQGNILDNVTDPDNDVVTVVSTVHNGQTFLAGQSFNTVYGTMLITAGGGYTFTPNPTARALNDGETGMVAFVINVRDERGATATVAMTVTVLGSDDEVPGGPGSATDFDALYASGFQLITNQDFYSRPVQAKPNKMTTYHTPGYIDPVFGTAIFNLTRVNDTSDNLTDLRHVYSRQQAVNADNTRSLARASNGWWHLFNLQTGQRVLGSRTQTPGHGALINFVNECEAVWHPTDPKKIWRTGNQGAGCIWYEYDIETMATTVLFDLNPLLAALGGQWATAGRAWWKGEGRCSDDGRWWGFQVETTNYGMIGLIMYDRQTNTIVGSQLTTNRPDHTSTSPKGEYIVPSWYGGAAETLASSALRPMNSANGARAYTRDFSSFTQLSALGEHSDLAIDAQGNEVFVSITYRGGSAGQEPDVPDGGLYYRRLDNGVAYGLPGNGYGGASDSSLHVSGLATGKPGWAVVSWYGGTPTTWKDGSIYVVELVPENAIVKRICHHQSVYGGNYINESHAVPSRDLRVIVFTSNFGGAVAEDYFVGLPSDAFGVAGGGRPPTNQAVPTVTGQVSPNSQLTSSAGTWGGIGLIPTYQWYRNGVVVNGATVNTLTIPNGTAAGTTYYCVVTMTNSAGSLAAQSNTITVQVPSAPVNTIQPSITGGSAINSVITANPGTWGGLPAPSFTYQWYHWNGTAYVAVTDADELTTVALELGNYVVDVTASNSQGSLTVRSTAKNIVGAADPKAAVGAAVAGNGTWGTGGTASIPDVAIGDSVLFILSIDEGSGDGNPNTIPSTILGKPLTLLFSTPLITIGAGRQVRQHVYVADKVTQAGTASIPFVLAADSHFAWQAQRFTGGIGAVDVASTPGFNAAGFASPHTTGTAATTIANVLEIISVVGATDMGNATLTIPAGYTSMGVDNAGPLVATSAYRVRSALTTIGGSITSIPGGYGSGWCAFAVALY